jgi:predicted RNA methylase
MRSGALVNAELIPSGEGAKARGAFYTDAQIADFLVGWALRSPTDTVMDPSFGGGVFLRSACIRLAQLGGHAAGQVFGVEIDPKVHARVSTEMAQEFTARDRHLVQADFFDIEAGQFGPVDAVVGNPPFIRYQRFSGDARRKALACASRAGVPLSSLSSSWAPFLVHGTEMLKPGGRLAMVLPVEIGYAGYALPVLAHLAKSFAKATFLTFRRKLFPQLSEDTLLLLAEGKGLGPAEFMWRDLAGPEKLAELLGQGAFALPGTRRLDTAALAEGRERLTECFVPRKAIELYRRLTSLGIVRRLDQLADVGIGYVTGANDFFHLGPDAAKEWRIPIEYLRPAVRRGRAFNGLRFTSLDWRRASKTGEAGYLLSIESEQGLPEAVLKYLAYGEKCGVPSAYKCRSRSPWFKVPHVYLPDAFLSYMSGNMPGLVANDADAVAPNTLHIVRLFPDAKMTSDALAALWQTSLTRLSAEIEGHAMGGGMLKLEPTEAQSVLLAAPRQRNGKLRQLAAELDALVRMGKDEAAQARADQVILRDDLGLGEADCRLLRTAAEHLRCRRYSRSSNHDPCGSSR